MNLKLHSALIAMACLALQAGSAASEDVQTNAAAAAGASLRGLSSSSHPPDTTTHTTGTMSHSSDDHKDCEAPYSILKCNKKVDGKTLAEYGDEFWKYVAETDNTRLAFQLDSALAEQYMLLNMPKPVLLLGGLICTDVELADNPDACNGVVPTPITRKRDVPLADFNFLYVPIYNFAGIADPAFCAGYGSKDACKLTVMEACFDDTKPGTFISFAQEALNTDGALTASVNGNTVPQNKRTLTTDSFLVTLVDPDVQVNIITPGSPTGLVDPPFYACDGAIAYMIEVNGPGTLVVESAVITPSFFVGPIRYELNFV